MLASSPPLCQTCYYSFQLAMMVAGPQELNLSSMDLFFECRFVSHETVSEYPWRFLSGERHTRRGLAMGRMGITNTIMLLQAIFLYTLSSDASLNAVNKISFYVDIVYRIALCLWLLLTGYRCVTSILCNLMQRRSDDLNPVDSDVTIRRCHLPQNTAP